MLSMRLIKDFMVCVRLLPNLRDERELFMNEVGIAFDVWLKETSRPFDLHILTLRTFQRGWINETSENRFLS